jgi:hypothetical protein
MWCIYVKGTRSEFELDLDRRELHVDCFQGMRILRDLNSANLATYVLGFV